MGKTTNIIKNEYQDYKRINTEKHRAYYIPFDESDNVKEIFGITDRTSSSLFFSLDGKWKIKEHNSPDAVKLDEPLTKTIPVPSCVQLFGYDKIQYINCRYPFPCDPPFVPKENPTYHYRKEFNIKKDKDKKYYLNFEGVDSAFYLFVNGKKKGYSEISHATSEFDITSLLNDGKNCIDVIVLKWCFGSYLECQDKFRFTGIFRSVYILTRPKKHITDYKITTCKEGANYFLNINNESEVGISLEFLGKLAFVEKNASIKIPCKGVKEWTSDNPNLYDLILRAEGEKIIEKVGFITPSIDKRVFKINGKAVKLKGVNRHDFNESTGATVTLSDMYKDVMLFKELNVNAVRTSHYPNAPEFYQLLDKYGIYAIDECDLEMHGACTRQGGYELKPWREYADNKIFEGSILDREIALIERDKNRPSVIMWSLGNESAFGKAFFKGAEYIRERDSRPVHYEGLQTEKNYDDEYDQSDLVDVDSDMYPSIEVLKDKALLDEKRKRPYLLCEYSHAMGNSCGDLIDYWKLIDKEPCLMGGFIWEWADHAIKTNEGYKYGGDFNETEHDSNFCVDGLLTPDRKIKSSAREMQAVYGGKRKSVVYNPQIPKFISRNKQVKITVDGKTGLLSSIAVGGEEILNSPIRFNFIRYTDNERKNIVRWKQEFLLDKAYPVAYKTYNKDGYEIYSGKILANTLEPLINYEIGYKVIKGELKIKLSYKIAEFISDLPRFGLELSLSKKLNDFTYIGYGPYESYVDKHIASDYNLFKSSAEENFTHYIRPQETGSHFNTTYFSVGGIEIKGEKPFSFSYNPYSTQDILKATHDYELKNSKTNYLCLDVNMRGVGSHSCGPELDKKYEIKRKDENEFTIRF